MTIRQRLLRYLTATALLSASLSGAAVVSASASSAAACPSASLADDGFTQVGTSEVCEKQFTSSTNWLVPVDMTIDVVVVGGGGAGGSGDFNGGGGGGGPGGINWETDVALTSGSLISVVIGDGGSSSAIAGSPSEFDGISAVGGDAGANAADGGSGGDRGTYKTPSVIFGIKDGGVGCRPTPPESEGREPTLGRVATLVSPGLFASNSLSLAYNGKGGGPSYYCGLTATGHPKTTAPRPVPGGEGASGAANTGTGGGGGEYATSGTNPGGAGGSGVVILRTLALTKDLTVQAEPSSGADNDAVFEAQPVVRVTEAGTSTPVSGAVVTASIASDPGGSPSLQGTTTATTDANGDAIFTDLAILGVMGDYTLSFSASGAASVTSSVITLSAGAAAAPQSVITTASTTVGTEQTTTVTVQAKDSAGNSVTASGDAVVLTPSAGSIGSITDNGDGTYTGTYTAPASTGVETISGTLNGSAIGTSASVTVKGSQIVTWTPTNTVLTMPGASISPDAFASTSGDGSVSYQVHSAGTSGCSVSSSSSPFTLTYIAAGTCTVRATAADTATYAEAFTDVDFEISLASQSITASSTATRLQPGQSATVSDSGSTGGGAITWTNTTPSKCTLVFPTVTADANGSCILTVDIAADATYAAASDTITITVFTPGGGGGSGGGSGGGGGSNGGSGGGSSSGGASTPGDSGSSSGASGSAASGDDSSRGDVESQDDVAVPGTGSSTRGRALPPPPEDVDVQQIPGRARSSVLIKQPAGAAGLQVASTVVVVRNAQGKVISRINVALKRGQGEIEVTVPFVADGYTVDVYNVNDVGVSTGALTRSPLIRATTITKRTTSGQPSLFGAMLGKPIIFNGGSAALDARDRKQLRTIARQAKASNERLFVTGFARKGGGTKSELASLSTKRARAAARYLSKQGVRVWIRYWGAGSLNGTGDASDRRVEVRTSAKPIPRTLVP